MLQTTLLPGGDDWTIDRFSMLEGYLRSLTDEDGKPLCEVTARDRQPDANGDDPVLSQLSRAEFDQLWLLALDTGDGLSPKDQVGILHFHLHWDVSAGCPSFVTEPPGTGMKDNPQAIADIHCYVRNLVRWLGG
ncbi:hypothetical protein [Thermoleptolyngbya sp.]